MKFFIIVFASLALSKSAAAATEFQCGSMKDYPITATVQLDGPFNNKASRDDGGIVDKTTCAATIASSSNIAVIVCGPYAPSRPIRPFQSKVIEIYTLNQKSGELVISTFDLSSSSPVMDAVYLPCTKK